MKDKPDNNKLSLADKLIKNKKQKFDKRFILAPKGILLIALSKYYDTKQKDKMKALDEFSKELLEGLSKLASDNESTDLFGDNFNDFFKMFITSLKNVARLAEILEENGIEVEIEEDEDEDEDDDD